MEEIVVERDWPRQDGTYASAEGPVWEYLRFFPDDLVASISSTLPPEIFAAHIVAGEPVFSYGVATRREALLEVTTRNDEGAVSFRVHPLKDGSLSVESHSHINGARFTSTYHFFPR